MRIGCEVWIRCFIIEGELTFDTQIHETRRFQVMSNESRKEYLALLVSFWREMRQKLS
jgi:hypothetical protein